jgi:hypothetical protein
MDQGHHLTPTQRRYVRQAVDWAVKQELSDRETMQWIHDFVWGVRPLKAYAYAYYAALQTTEPLDLDLVRDSRS